MCALSLSICSSVNVIKTCKCPAFIQTHNSQTAGLLLAMLPSTIGTVYAISGVRLILLLPVLLISWSNRDCIRGLYGHGRGYPTIFNCNGAGWLREWLRTGHHLATATVSAGIIFLFLLITGLLSWGMSTSLHQSVLSLFLFSVLIFWWLPRQIFLICNSLSDSPCVEQLILPDIGCWGRYRLRNLELAEIQGRCAISFLRLSLQVRFLQ